MSVLLVSVLGAGIALAAGWTSEAVAGLGVLGVVGLLSIRLPHRATRPTDSRALPSVVDAISPVPALRRAA
jgi:hypothetical protein